MKLTVRRLTSDGRFETEAADTLAAVRQDEGGILWVDLAGVIAADLRRDLGHLGLPDLDVALVIDPATRFDILVHEDAVCFNVTAPAAWSEHPDDALVHVFVLDRALVTAHTGPLPQLSEALAALTRLDPRLPRTTFGLVASLLRIFYIADGNFFHRVRRQAAELEELLDSSIQSFSLARLVAIERAASRLSSTWLDNEVALQRLSGVAVKALTVDGHTSAIDVMSENARLFRQGVQELDNRLDKVHRHYESLMQAVTEKRLRFLTVVSSVFLPLTLIAGIYGMNFAQIPALHVKYGYEIVLGVMLALGLGAVLYFYRKGWFR